MSTNYVLNIYALEMSSNKSKKSESYIFTTATSTGVTTIRTLRISTQSDSNHFYHQAIKDSKL